MQSPLQSDLLILKASKSDHLYQQIAANLSSHPKNILIIYDKQNIYILNDNQVKMYSIGKYIIVQLAYFVNREVIIVLTVEGMLMLIFLKDKVRQVVRKDLKRNVCFEWNYALNQVFHFFVADQTGLKLYKLQEEKKNFKEVKSMSGKYNSFLYQPLTQTLVGFPVGDCKQIQPFVFNASKYDKWFKTSAISINFENNQQLLQKSINQKSLGLEWSCLTRQIFVAPTFPPTYSTLLKLNKRCHLLLFFASQGQLKLIPISQQKQKQITIKLPSDTIPEFIVVDNMLVVHLKVEGITFIYDLNGVVLQPLVSPYPLRHQAKQTNIYQSVFLGQRVIKIQGKSMTISKYRIQLSVIFNYIKNQLQIFDFLIKRKQGKMQLLMWLRRDLFKLKEINISKFWKSMFIKYLSNNYPQSQVINLIDLYSNVFYTVSLQPLIPKQRLLSIILQCFRQSFQLKMAIPIQLQSLVFDLLLQYKKYQMLVYLSHNQIIKDNEEFRIRLVEEYLKDRDMIVGTLAVDMTFRIGKPKDMVKVLMKFDRLRDAKKFIKQNYDKLDVLYIIQVAKYIQNQTLLADYLRYIKSFILLKYPAMNIAYLNQAEQKVFSISKQDRQSALSRQSIKL